MYSMHRYSWCSSNLVEDIYRWSYDVCIDDLIPLETSSNGNNSLNKRKLGIGHNVAFDRSFVKEQYYIEVQYSVIFLLMSIQNFCLLVVRPGSVFTNHP